MGGIPDSKNRLTTADGQSFTTQAVTVNYMKLGKTDNQIRKMIGLVGNLVKCWVKTAFTGLASGVRLEIVVDTAAAFNVDPEVLASTGVLSLAELNSGKPIQLVIPPTELSERLTLLDADVFLALRWTPVSEAGATGALIVQIDDSGESVVA